MLLLNVSATDDALRGPECRANVAHTIPSDAMLTDELALRAHAGRYDLDISPLVAVGHSAGGHLALWLSGRDRLPADSPLRTADPIEIDTVISLGGLPDLEEAAREPGSGCGTAVIGQLTGGHFEDTSVPRLAPLGVRQILINGLDDRIIPPAYAASYAVPMRAAGDEVTVMLADGGSPTLLSGATEGWLGVLMPMRV